MKRNVLSAILVLVLMFSFAFTGCSETDVAGEDEIFDNRSGNILTQNVMNIPSELIDLPEYQGSDGVRRLGALQNMLAYPTDVALSEIVALTDLTINSIYMDKPQNCDTVEEEIDYYIENQLDDATELATDQVLFLCTEQPKETAFRAGEDVYDVFPEEVLQQAADAIDSAEDELMTNRFYRGMVVLLDYMIENQDIDYLPYSHLGEYAHYRNPELLMGIKPASMYMIYRSINTAQDALEVDSIGYLLNSLHTYSGASVYMTPYITGDEQIAMGFTEPAYETYEEQAQYYLDSSHENVMLRNKVLSASEYNGVAISYDTETGEGAILLEEDVQDLLTDEDITTILSAFTEGDTEYDKVLSGTKQLIKCVFDSREFEYPEESVIADVINGTYDNEGLDTMKLTIIIGGAVFAIAAIAAVIVTVRQRKKRSNLQ